MCSIIGASTAGKIDVNTVELLYMLGEQRGGHGCGYVDRDGNLVKSTSRAPKFIQNFTEDVPEFIGHTRYKTIGVSKEENNHPFKFENVVGVHNGTIYNNGQLQDKEGVKFEVDSEMLYYLINKYGLKKTLPQLIGKVGLAFWDSYGILNLYRFDRPLAIGYRDDVLFYASLPQYLVSIGCTDVKEIPEHTLYRIKDNRIISAKALKKELMPVKYEPKNSATYFTCEAWFKMIEDSTIRTQALINENSTGTCRSMEDALLSGFWWNNSPEGFDYWMYVYRNIEKIKSSIVKKEASEESTKENPPTGTEKKTSSFMVKLYQTGDKKFTMAPANYFPGKDGDRDLAWWFSDVEENEINVEVAYDNKYMGYQVDSSEGLEDLQDDYPDIVEDLLTVLIILEKKYAPWR